MPIDDRQFGEFVGSTNTSLKNIAESLQRGNVKFDGFDKRLRALESRPNSNGWRGAVRPGAIGTGAATTVLVIWEAIKSMGAGG